MGLRKHGLRWAPAAATTVLTTQVPPALHRSFLNLAELWRKLYSLHVDFPTNLFKVLDAALVVNTEKPQ